MELNKVCWIGGTARSGKTTICNRFAGDDVRLYHMDDVFLGKFTTSEENQPLLWKLQNEEPYNIMKMPPDDCVNVWLKIYKESFGIIKNEIADLETSDTVIVEGICLLPDLLYDSGITNACFILSPQEFFENEVAKLTEFQSEVQEHDESKLISNNVNALMLHMRNIIEEQAKKYSFNIIPVDSTHDLETNSKLVAECFSLSLPQHT